MKLAIVASLVLCSCSSAPRPGAHRPASATAGAAATAAPATTGPTAQALRIDAGNDPILIVTTDQGLIARNVAGSWSRVLVPGTLDALLYQPERRVLWLVQHGDLSVLDFDTGTVTPMATGLVRPEFAVIDPDGHRAESWLPGAQQAVELVLDWRAQTLTPGEVAFYGAPDTTLYSDDKALAAAKLVGADWLRAQRGRTITQIARDSWVDADDICETCKATDIGKPALHHQLVWQIVSCDDGICEGNCTLYDPTADEDVDRPDSPCNLSFDASETLWISDDQVCDAEGCSDIKGTIIGWLDPGQLIVEPTQAPDSGDDDGD